MPGRLIPITAAAGMFGFASMAAAATVTLTPTKDNTLYENSNGSLSNGAGEYLFAGRTEQTSSISRRRALLAFNVAAAVPAGAEIQSAALTLHMSRTATSSTAVSLHKVLADWGEGASNALGEEGGGALATLGDATWIHTFFNTSLWTSPGGQFAPAASASQNVVGNGFYTWASTPALVADVQGWLDQPGTNFGWLLLGIESAPLTAKRFDSRENSDPSLRPVLTVVFATPQPCCLPGGSCDLLLGGACLTAGGTVPGGPLACEGDADGDGVDSLCGDDCPSNPDKTSPGVCGCLVPDVDTDHDGVADCIDGCPNDANKTDPGICGCGLNDSADTDGDTVPDCLDRCSGFDDRIDEDGDGIPDCFEAIPAVSQWGLIILTLLLLSLAKVYFPRRSSAV